MYWFVELATVIGVVATVTVHGPFDHSSDPAMIVDGYRTVTVD